MKRNFRIIIFLASVIAVVILFSCNKKSDTIPQETILTGKTTILVDETIKPIIEDQIQIFESQYNAEIAMVAKSEKECLNDFLAQKEKIVVLSRKLTDNESSVFKAKKITPKTTVFAKDAIVLIVNKEEKDSLIDFQEIIHFVKEGRVSTRFKGLVFDNPNSSTVRFICENANIEKLPETGIFSFASNEEVIQYVAQNKGMIGIIGVNNIFQPKANLQEVVTKVKMLKVKYNTNDYIAPSQESIAQGIYPLARLLYIVNCQGYVGLGMGFSSFVAGEIGQRIILTSGLSPVNMPTHDIRIRKEIIKDKNKN